MASQRTGPFGRLLERIWPKKFTRQFQRRRMQADCELVSTLRMVTIVGRLKDISEGGCLFRPRSFYLMDRVGDTVVLLIDEHRIEGEIVRTLPIGYSVRFLEPADAAMIDAIAKAHPVPQASTPATGPASAPASAQASASAAAPAAA
jgi:hypothetical protein